MAFTKKTWVNVPDPSNPPSIPEGQDALARFDAENMNRIEDGIEEVATSGAIGIGAVAKSGGGAVGSGASANGGFAGGDNALAKNGGGAVGFGALSDVGFAGGNNAKTVNAAGNSIDAIQLGTGVNPNSKTLQVYNHTLMTADGTIPAGRMPSKAPSGHGLGELTKFHSSDFIDMIKHGGGFYVVGDATDSPTGNTNWLNLIQLSKEYVEGKDNETGVQIVVNSLNGGGDIWFRNVFVGTAYDWKEILHSGNLGKYTAKTELKSYTGTGLDGEENACQATFSFAPRIVIMLNAIGYTGYSNNKSIMELDKLTTEYVGACGFHYDGGHNWAGKTQGKKSEDGKTIYWYMSGSESNNMSGYFYNSLGRTYYLLAIE